MGTSSVTVRTLTPVVGTEVTGLDLRVGLDDELVADLRALLVDRGVLVLPDQHLDPAALESFGRRFGEPFVVPYLAPHAVDGHPGVLRVTNMGKAGTLTENWHYDSAYFVEPPPIAVLAAQSIPPVGGDTMWANEYAAYDALSPRMQQLLEGLEAAFTGSVVDDDGVRRDVCVYHPIVRMHPETGRKAIGVGRIESVPHIEGMTEAESRPLLQFLYEHASRPEFVYRHRWRPGDVVMWDNRCTMHYAIHDYGDEERLMHRITIV